MLNRLHGRAEATTDRLLDDSERQARHAMHASQDAALDALDGLGSTARQMQDRYAPRLGQFAERAEDLARRSADTMREQSQMLRERAAYATDRTRGYVRDEPFKSLLIAMAAGAALMAVAGLMGRSSMRDRY